MTVFAINPRKASAVTPGDITEPNTENRQSFILHRFGAYVFISVALFLSLTGLMLYPQIRSTLDNLQTQSDKISAQTYASIIDRYIEDREFALSDIVQSPFVINTLLLAQGERPDFRDYINQASLLKEDPELTILDINADILYSERDDISDYSWALDLVNTDTQHILNLQVDGPEPQFELGIPIMFGRGREGVAIARFSAKPDRIFNSYNTLNDTSGVSYKKGSQVVRSNLSEIEHPHNETAFVEKYGLSISHITSRNAVRSQRHQFIFKFLLTSLVAAILAFTLLMFYGRRMIVTPYLELAVTKDAIAQAVEGISRVDTEGRYTHVNKAYANTAGYEPNELVGKNWSLTVDPDDLDMLNEAYRDMLETGSVTAEARGISKSGKQFHKQVTMISQHDSHGKFIGHHCFMKDISNRKHSELQREKLIEKLSESNEELERFAYVCSHDLQEPLRMIRSFSEKLDIHLKDTLKDDVKGKKYLNFVTDGAQRSQDLIRDILSYSSINSDTTNLEIVDLNKLLQAINKTLCSVNEMDAKSLTWGDLPRVVGNKTQLYQLFQNLVNNGLKYQNPESTARVNISVADHGPEWKFSIQDNGIGMAEKHLGKIFDIFQRLHRRSEYAGTGIGLSICKKIVERHGGKIWVDSQVGEGSIFSLTLPKPYSPTTRNLIKEHINVQYLEIG
jgi:PAS domain S-box-containing protein